MGGIGRVLNRFWRDRSGISASEYALISAVLAIGVILAIEQLTGVVYGNMHEVADCLDGTLPRTGCQ